MHDDVAVVRTTLDGTRARWRRVAVTTALGRWASAAALVVFLALSVYWLVLPTDGWLLTLGVIAAGASAGLLVPAVRSSWSAPSDRQVARFIEERCPELEDRLATATECLVAPAVVGRSAPAAVGRSDPAVVGRSDPAGVGRSDPAGVGRSAPAVVGRNDPAGVGRSDSAVVGRSDSAVVGRGDPAVVGRSAPAVVGRSDPAVVGRSDPAVVGRSDPAAVGRSDPAVVGRSDPAVVGRSDPAVVGRSDSAVVGRSFSFGYGDHLVADTAKRLRDVDLDRIVEPGAFRRALSLTAASAGALALVLYAGRAPVVRAIDLASLYAFPGHVRIVVTPGDVRLPVGRPLVVNAQVTGTGPVTPSLVVVSGGARRVMAMHATPTPDSFTIAVEGVSANFKYSVDAGGAHSDQFSVTVVHAPTVKRIDLRYTYPKAFGMEPRTEENGGDIYGPAGTKVRLDVFSDKPLKDAALVLADGRRVPLATEAESNARTEIELTEDTSYRIALSDRDGLINNGDTEYFVRLLSDRPPDVRIVQPAADSEVTALEEVNIEARADDDHGIERFELVYAVRGGKEKVLPFPVDSTQPTVEGHRLLAMEELGVKPGDFVSYYARARDVSRGKRSTEARSDIFFLQVKGFEEEFSLAQSGAMGGGGPTPFDDLAAAQKEIIIATWKLDRRALDGQSGRSADDIKAVAAAQGQLRQKTEQQAAQRGGVAAIRRRLRPGQESPNENPLTLAAAAMGRAETALNKTDTKAALPPEMEALDHLLKAQAEIRRSQVTRQQANGGGGGYGRQGQDLSTLFDRELQRQQQTNYENPTTTEQTNDSQKDEALDKIHELARRQDELAKRQEELAQKKKSLGDEEFKRQLERLTREQSDLRRQAEEMSQQMSRQQGRQGQGQGQGQGRGQGRMREISEEMRNAANDLRNRELDKASVRSGRAGQMLRDLEQQMGSGQPNERMRQLGDMQLEARQLAEAQQRVASEASRMTNRTTPDEMRRLAGEKDRIADRTQALADAAKRADLKQVDAESLQRQMRESAGRLRSQAQMTEGDARNEQRMQQEYERMAERIGAAGGRADGDADRVTGNMSKAQELRQRFERLSREQDQLREQASRGGQRGGDQSGGLREEQQKNLQEAKRLMDELRQLNPGAVGGTPEGQQMVTSAPGTEAFKQDFSKWDELKKAIDSALDKTEQNFAQALREKLAKDRLNAGVGDHTPEQYRKLVEKYYKSLAERRK